MTTYDNLEAELDFTGNRKEKTRKETKISETIKNKIQFDKFKNVALGVMGVTLVTALGFGGNAAWQNHKENQIHNEELIVQQAKPENILSAIDSEKMLAEKTFAINNILFTKYADLKDVIEIMNLQNSVSTKINTNKSIYNDVLSSLNQDQNQIKNVIAAIDPNVSLDKKEKELLGSADIKKFNQWKNSVDINQTMYVGNLIKVGKDTEKELIFLAETKAEIIKTVQEKIKSKDYNLEATKTALSQNVSKDLSGTVNELKQIRSTIKGTEQDSSLTDKDVAEVEEATTDLQNQAIEKISQDKTSVENMINKFNKEQTSDKQQTNTVAQNQQPQVIEKTTVIHDGGSHMNMFDYYLLYSWLSGGSSTTPAAAAITNNHYHYNSQPSPLQTRLNQASSSRYSINDNNSYLNKKISNNFGNSTGNQVSNINKANTALNKVNTYKRIDIAAIKAKIEQTRTKAYQAQNVYKQVQAKKAEVKYASSAPKVKSTYTSSYKSSSSSRSSSRSRR